MKNSETPDSAPQPHRCSGVVGRLVALGLSLAMAALAPAPLAAQPSLSTRLSRLLDEAPLDRNLWGVAVLDARGRLLFGRNAERLFMPASNAKILVSTVGAALFGPEERVRTSLYAAGPVFDGVLESDLVLYGRGDPTFGANRCFALDTLPAGACDRDPMTAVARLASAVKARGIVRIAGDVVGDGSYFEPAAVHPTWENDDLLWSYGAPVSGLGFAENTIVLTIRPGDTIGAPAAIEVEPSFAEIEIDNRTTTVSGEAEPVTIERAGPGWRFVVQGAVRSRARPDREALAAPDGNAFAAMALRRALLDSGIVVEGRARGTADSLATLAARATAPLAEAVSRPMSDWIFAILNVSQNWYAETLLKQLGKRWGAEGSWARGLAIERRFLIDSVGVDSTQFLLHDGSGLSAKNLVTPLTLAKSLAFIRKHPRYPTFEAGLPRGGSPGTLRNRFEGSDLAGRVRAKTGSIGQVNTLSGFIEQRADTGRVSRPPGRVFSVQANHHTLGGRAMIRAIDSLVVEIARPTPSARRRQDR
ncbi:MAG: D-alanyl-D-alanine carboxypeptidase/D-alanyl-D-alanine-endopeptidase [Gemmatimonadales bacterium]